MDVGIINYIDKVGVYKDIKWDDISQYDLLLISLGTNDNSYINSIPELREKRIKEFKENYKKLIESELKKNKDLKILMIYGTLNEKDVYYLIEGTYEYLKPLFENLYIHKFNGDSSAISNHAFVDSHDLMSEELKNVIKEIL